MGIVQILKYHKKFKLLYFMKKVRFESPIKAFKIQAMQDSECHSPRPFIERQIKSIPNINFLTFKPVPYTNDPIQTYECSNSSPCPKVSKTYLANISNIDNNKCLPSNELELSTLDCAHYDGGNTLRKSNSTVYSDNKNLKSNFNIQPSRLNEPMQILCHTENKVSSNPTNALSKSDDFFLKKHDLKNFKSKASTLHLDKENNPLLKKKELMHLGNYHEQTHAPTYDNPLVIDNVCRCHNCVQILHSKPCLSSPVRNKVLPANSNNFNTCHCVTKPANHPISCWPCSYQAINPFPPICGCSNSSPKSTLKNAVDKKTWDIERYEKSQKTECLDLEVQSTTKEKREPTVADLFKIIKLQNEQLLLLQEKVDKFISTNNKKEAQVTQPIQNYVTEHTAMESVGSEQKISIGVMTSFEMIRTSTIINKEIVKQNEAQIQCNRSQISIKEVVSKAHPVNLNFLDGITPMTKGQTKPENKNNKEEQIDLTKNTDNFHEDKTLNEMSLYNIQVDNAITPLMSPEQSLYLDVRDYSDSDASSDDQSNVGWTYYNKVMTHVNGILQESDMPSSASALYRKARQKCMQVQIDKTNVSAKRVTFGDDPLINQPLQAHINAPTTDTSIKMNQLAAKYLKNGPLIINSPSPKPTVMPLDMSLATRNYMEKHKLIQQGTNLPPKPCTQLEIPRFLDITALKKQPKLL